MSTSMMTAFIENGRNVMLDQFRSLYPNAPDTVSEDSKLVMVQTALNGSQGVFRNPNKKMALVSADNDYAAIQSWIEAVGKRSESTKRAYEKEAIRLMAWSIIEL